MKYRVDGSEWRVMVRGVCVAGVLLLAGGCVLMQPRMKVSEGEIVDVPARPAQPPPESPAPEPPEPPAPAPLAQTVPQDLTPSRRDETIPVLPLPADAPVPFHRALVRLSVENVTVAQDALVTLANEVGGRLKSLEKDSVTLWVPVEALKDVLGRLDGIGQVIEREVHAEALSSAQVVDAEARIDNLEQLRRRLGELLAKGTAIEELLKVEREMARVTGEIERLKARLQHLKESAAFSVLTIRLDAPDPVALLEHAVPFAWVRTLGEDVRRVSSGVSPGGRRRGGLQVAVPDGFVVLEQEKHSLRAISGGGDQVLVRRHENFGAATMEFWELTARRWLSSGAGIKIEERTGTRSIEKRPAVWIVGSRRLGDKSYRYLLGILSTEDEVFSFEAWGLAASLDGYRPELVTEFRSMRVE